MKKILPFLFCLTSLPAFAVRINADTQLKWNGVVVEAAARDAAKGFVYYKGIETAFFKILSDLLERETFSVEEAVGLCVLVFAEYRDETEDNRASICEKFGYALIEHNNKGTDAINLADNRYAESGKVYSADKKFYALETEKTVKLEYQGLECSHSVFETATGKEIAICNDYEGEGCCWSYGFKIIDSRYNGYYFVFSCSDPSWAGGSGDYSCRLDVGLDDVSKVYTSDKKFYVETKATDGEYNIRETATKKIVAKISKYTGRIDIVEPKYKTFGFYTDNITMWLSYIDHTEEYKALERIYEQCLNVYQFIDLYGAQELATNKILDGYVYNFVNWASFDRQLRNLKDRFYTMGYENLERDINRLCKTENGEYVTFSSYFNDKIKEARSVIGCAKSYFSTSDKFAKVQTKSLEEATSKIKESIQCDNVDKSSIKCTGNCNKTGQDYVTCSWGNLMATFEFDDICD